MSTDTQSTPKPPLRVIVVGMGVRSMIYTRVALTNPELLESVVVVDTDERRREYARVTFGLCPENCFSTVDELVAVPKFADAVINGTMDRLHVSTSLPILRHGYDMLLEKPMEINLWRAPVDNDMHVRKLWESAYYDQTIARAYETSYT